jgi:hypothetical protein
LRIQWRGGPKREDEPGIARATAGLKAGGNATSNCVVAAATARLAAVAADTSAAFAQTGGADGVPDALPDVE